MLYMTTFYKVNKKTLTVETVYIKIGYTGNLGNRILNYLKHVPVLDFIGVKPGHYEEEAKAHAQLASLGCTHYRGDWYIVPIGKTPEDMRKALDFIPFE